VAAGSIGTTQLGSLTVNDQTDSYTLLVGDVNKRVVMNKATATTLTVPNSVFSAGQVVHIVNKGAGTCTVTAGAGTTVSTSGSLALAQNATGTLIALSASAFIFEAGGVTATPGALTLISATTIGTTVSSVTVSSAFSSTYDNYLITISGGAASTSVDLIMQLGATTTNYTRTGYYVTLGSATLTGFTGTDWRVGGGSTDSIMGMVDLFGPNLTKRTTGVTNYIQPVTSGTAVHGFLLLNDTTSYTAFTISTNTGTITGGTIRVYGYANS
jgi:hypothetical protein